MMVWLNQCPKMKFEASDRSYSLTSQLLFMSVENTVHLIHQLVMRTARVFHLFVLVDRRGG